MSTIKQIVLASGNEGKVRELMAMFEPLGIEILPQSQFDVPDVEETGLTFVENALIKARNAAEFSGLPAIADDSGIAVDALDGAPGIYSARFAGPDATDESNNLLLLEKLQGLPEEQRGARFICAMVFLRHSKDPCPIIAQGSWEGQILEEEHGTNGFGYDPLFWVPSRALTSAQLEPELKNLISHRAKAARKLVYLLDENRNPDDESSFDKLM